MTMATIEAVTVSEEDGVTVDREELEDGARIRCNMEHHSQTQVQHSLVAREVLDLDQQSVEEEGTDKVGTTKTHTSKEGINKEGFSKVVFSQDINRVDISRVDTIKVDISKVVFSKADINKVVINKVVISKADLTKEAIDRTMDIRMVSNRTGRRVARIITREGVEGEGVRAEDVGEAVGVGVADDDREMASTSSLLVFIGSCCF